MSILQMSIRAGVFIVAIVLIRAITLNKLPKITFLVLWAVALVRLLVPFSISSQFSIYTLVSRFLDRTSASPPPTPGAALLQNKPFIDGAGVVDTTAQTIGQQAISIDPLLLAWLIGMVAAFIFFAAVFWRNCMELRFSWIVRDNAVIDEWLNGHKLPRPISVLQSDRITTPITVGYLRPRIILPKAMDMRGEQLLRYVLTHEYYHIRRFDAVWKLLVTIALCVHWFNPLVWIMVILVNRDLEITCDEMVVRHFGADTKAAYAYSVIGMAEQRSKLVPLFSGFSKNAAEERITAIMKYKKTSVMAILLAAVLVMGMTTVFAANKDTSDFYAGDIIIAQISADSVSDLYAYEFKLRYDESAVKLKSLHSTVDGFNTILHRFFDGYLLVNATKDGNSDGFTKNNTPICEIVMEVLRDGPVEGLSINDVCIVDSAMKLQEDISGWVIKVVPNASIGLEGSENSLYELPDELPELPETVYLEEPISVELGQLTGDYSGQLRIGVEKQDVSPGESCRVKVSLSEPTKMFLNEPAETTMRSAAKLTCWFDPDELTYQGFDGNRELHVLSETVDTDSGIVSITFITLDYRLDSFGSFRFMVPESSQSSGRQSSLSVVADYVIKDGEDRLLLSQSGEILISILP